MGRIFQPGHLGLSHTVRSGPNNIFYKVEQSRKPFLMPLIMHEYICIYSYYCYVRSTPREVLGKRQIVVDDYIK